MPEPNRKPPHPVPKTRHTSMKLTPADLSALSDLCAHHLTAHGVRVNGTELLRSLVRAEHSTPTLTPTDIANLPPGAPTVPTTKRLTPEDLEALAAIQASYDARFPPPTTRRRGMRTSIVRALIAKAHRDRCSAPTQTAKTTRKRRGK